MKKLFASVGLMLMLSAMPLAVAEEQTKPTFEQAAGSLQQRLEASLRELSELRAKSAEQMIPLSRQLGELESELTKARSEFQQTTRILDSRTLDLTNLRNEIKSRQDETGYLTTLMTEYIRNFESRLHITELQRYRPPLDTARLAMENTQLNELEVFKAQSALLTLSLDRLGDALGGKAFEGQAVDAGGMVKPGRFVVVGPLALFASNDGATVGTAEQRLGSLEPTVIPFSVPEDALAAGALVKSGSGHFPMDPTLGNAHKIEATQETLMEHIKKGGPVMVPIFVLAGAALLVALYKWLMLTLQRRPSRKHMQALLDAVAKHDAGGAMNAAKRIGGHTGAMLVVGAEHIKEPRELIEEVMYEKVMTAKLKVTRFIPFIAIAASSAPLLGLLGTVTGIINTFKLITVFGTGDVKMLSSGISEALITTEYGLIVAIPSLLLHAFLNRKARGIVDDMEKAAVAFVNQVSKAGSTPAPTVPPTPPAPPAPTTPPPSPSTPESKAA